MQSRAVVEGDQRRPGKVSLEPPLLPLPFFSVYPITANNSLRHVDHKNGNGYVPLDARLVWPFRKTHHFTFWSDKLGQWGRLIAFRGARTRLLLHVSIGTLVAANVTTPPVQKSGFICKGRRGLRMPKGQKAGIAIHFSRELTVTLKTPFKLTCRWRRGSKCFMASQSKSNIARIERSHTLTQGKLNTT